MSDADEVAFLQWALPQLHLRWAGFRRVRGQVQKRIARRCAALGLRDLAAYRAYLVAHPDEWVVLDGLCRVTISRFARDRAVWTELLGDVLPRLARDAAHAGRPAVRAWSAGCGAGEEPYTLVIAWELVIAPTCRGIALDVLATDAHTGQLARAAAARYPSGTLRELPVAWRDAAFDPVDGEEQLRARFRAPVRFAHHDLRTPPREGAFDLVLCRNVAFTYFDDTTQREVAAALHGALRPGGVLVVGAHEQLPAGVAGFAPAAPGRRLYVATEHAAIAAAPAAVTGSAADSSCRGRPG